MKKTKTKSEKIEQKTKLKEMLADTQSDIWLETNTLVQFLNFASKFTKYSYNNQSLIFAQKPGATAVKTFKGWKDLGRNVKKGEKGIEIFAPLLFKDTEKPVLDEDGSPKLDDDGNPVMKKVRYSDYTIKYVYDISQTEGDPVPGLETGSEDPLFETEGDLYDALKQAYPELTRKVSSEMVLDTCKAVLASFSDASCDKEADCAAYMLSSYLQMDLPADIPNSVFQWGKEKDAKELAAAMGRVQKATKIIIDTVEKEVA